MVGAPVDIAAQQSSLSALAEATPLIMFQSLVNFGDGRVIGRNLARFWGNDTTDANGIRESLQTLQPIGSLEFTQLSRIAQLDQRTAVPDQCLHSAEADVRPSRRKS
jgi:poly(3-hydroxybutyrate) depolymerase